MLRHTNVEHEASDISLLEHETNHFLPISLPKNPTNQPTRQGALSWCKCQHRPLAKGVSENTPLKNKNIPSIRNDKKHGTHPFFREVWKIMDSKVTF